MDPEKLREAIENALHEHLANMGGDWFVEVEDRDVSFRPSGNGKIVIHDDFGTVAHEFEVRVDIA